MRISEEGNGYFILDDYYGKKLYIESDKNEKTPCYIEVSSENDKISIECIHFTDLENIAELLASINQYCYGVHEQISEIADILKIDYEYKEAVKKKNKEVN